MNFSKEHFYRKLSPLVNRDTEFWKQQKLVQPVDANVMLGDNIKAGTPFAASRIGGVEARVIAWGGMRTVGLANFPFPIPYFLTTRGATNAGIRPRNKESYRAYAKLAMETLSDVDLLGVWENKAEATVLRSIRAKPASYCRAFALSPMQKIEPHWIRALAGKRLLIVSPFTESIRKQSQVMEGIWRDRELKWDSPLKLYQFPYLIDDDCPLDWRDVFSEISQVLEADDYDIALFGCGGLGQPLASVAKRCGKIGIHIGGYLQLVFGIYGERNLAEPKHVSWFNEHWTRPAPEEVPQSHQRVENSCYW